MNKILSIALLSCAVLAGQPTSNLRVVRDIRLENLKRDHSGRSIHFVDSNSRHGQGILLDVTDKSIIISELGSPVSYDHSGIDHVFVDPEMKEMAMVIGLGALGGLAGYLGIILGHSDPDAAMKGVTSSLGAGLATLVGYRTFYKPIKIDISGRAHG